MEAGLQLQFEVAVTTLGLALPQCEETLSEGKGRKKNGRKLEKHWEEGVEKQRNKKALSSYPHLVPSMLKRGLTLE